MVLQCSNVVGSNPVEGIYMYVWKLNQTVLELNFIFIYILKLLELDCCQIKITNIYIRLSTYCMSISGFALQDKVTLRPKETLLINILKPTLNDKWLYICTSEN
jgi:hypothetical protein